MIKTGGVAERPIAPVLKTGNAQAFEGSNPSPSARFFPWQAAVFFLISVVHVFKLGHSVSILRDWRCQVRGYFPRGLIGRVETENFSGSMRDRATPAASRTRGSRSCCAS